jgi:hypothetical protein
MVEALLFRLRTDTTRPHTWFHNLRFDLFDRSTK